MSFIVAGIGAGLVSALLFAVVITGSPLAFLLSYAAPLPVFIVALGWRHLSGLVAAIAGLALIGTIAGALKVALDNEANREAAMITFLVTLSGVVLGGVGSAFWGVVAGAIALAIQHYGQTKPSAP